MHSGRILLIAVAALSAAAVVYFVGYLPRERTTKELDLAAAARRNTPPLVNAATVKRAAQNSQLLLPGNITPITEAYIFARAAGYLKRRYVDIGDRVAAGQKLADIEAPDLDQQVSQSEAALAQAQGQLGQARALLEQLTATRDLCGDHLKRYKVLTDAGAVSRQDGDNSSTAAKTADASVIAQQKTVAAAEEFVRASTATFGTVADAAKLRTNYCASLQGSSPRATSMWARSFPSPGPLLGLRGPMPPHRPIFRAGEKFFVWRRFRSFAFWWLSRRRMPR